MIKFINISQEKPYLVFKSKYEEAIAKNQKNIEAMSISSFNAVKGEVDSRFVNLKFIDKSSFIFFSNYNSPKSEAFDTHNQVSIVFFWSEINSQIRMKAHIKKTNEEYNNEYFKQRSYNKNALAISSNQSKKISSFNIVQNQYDEVKANHDLSKCPSYWGGFTFKPYEIEFWKGNANRLNKRELYVKSSQGWKRFILEP